MFRSFKTPTVALLVLTSATLQSAPVAAEVLAVSSDGFTVGGEKTLLNVSEQDVWTMLIRPARWWSSEHSWSGDAANMTIDPVAGGCFCEALPNSLAGSAQGSVEHMRVIHALPGQLLRMRGSLGPLQSEALSGVLTIEISWASIVIENPPGVEVDLAATIKWTYVVGGYAQFPLEQIAPAVDAVIGEQMLRLGQAVETVPGVSQ